MRCPSWSQVQHAQYLGQGWPTGWSYLCSGLIHQSTRRPVVSTWSFPSLPQEPSGADRDYFWLRPILPSSLPPPGHRPAHQGQLLKPRAHWQLFRAVCAWPSQGLPGWLSPGRAPIALSQGGSAACFYASNQRATSSHLAVSHAHWLGKQLWAAKFNPSHFRKWDAERFWD